MVLVSIYSEKKEVVRSPNIGGDELWLHYIHRS